MAEQTAIQEAQPGDLAAGEEPPMTEALKLELENITNVDRAAVIMLLLGEQQAADIIRYLDPKEVQGLGAAMVGVADLSQEAVNIVLDDFVSTIKKQTNLGLGTTDYVESVLKRALGEDKASSVLGRIMPGSSSKGLEILRWMDARSIAEMIVGEHPQVVANRILDFVEVIGERERVIASTDCGFSTFAGYVMVANDVAWAKLKTLSEGAKIASSELWSN